LCKKFKTKYPSQNLHSVLIQDDRRAQPGGNLTTWSGLLRSLVTWSGLPHHHRRQQVQFTANNCPVYIIMEKQEAGNIFDFMNSINTPQQLLNQFEELTPPNSPESAGHPSSTHQQVPSTSGNDTVLKMPSIEPCTNYHELFQAAQRLQMRDSKDVVLEQVESSLGLAISKMNIQGMDSSAIILLYQMYLMLRTEHLFLKDCTNLILLSLLDLKEHEAMLKRRRLEDTRKKPAKLKMPSEEETKKLPPFKLVVKPPAAGKGVKKERKCKKVVS